MRHGSVTRVPTIAVWSWGSRANRCPDDLPFVPTLADCVASRGQIISANRMPFIVMVVAARQTVSFGFGIEFDYFSPTLISSSTTSTSSRRSDRCSADWLNKCAATVLSWRTALLRLLLSPMKMPLVSDRFLHWTWSWSSVACGKMEREQEKRNEIKIETEFVALSKE